MDDDDELSFLETTITCIIDTQARNLLDFGFPFFSVGVSFFFNCCCFLQRKDNRENTLQQNKHSSPGLRLAGGTNNYAQKEAVKGQKVLVVVVRFCVS